MRRVSGSTVGVFTVGVFTVVALLLAGCDDTSGGRGTADARATPDGSPLDGAAADVAPSPDAQRAADSGGGGDAAAADSGGRPDARATTDVGASPGDASLADAGVDLDVGIAVDAEAPGDASRSDAVARDSAAAPVDAARDALAADTAVDVGSPGDAAPLPGRDSAADTGSVFDAAPPPMLDAAFDFGRPCRGAITVQVSAAPEPEAVAGARVTLLEVEGERFWEARTGDDGVAEVSEVPRGRYTVGASARDRAYVEEVVEIADDCPTVELALGPEVEPGRWDIVGDPGEALGGTNSGVLLADGRVLYCHDTRDPVIFDPAAEGPGRFRVAADSMRIQGCHAVTAMPDGRLLYVGGADRAVYGPGTRQVKVYDPALDRWTTMNDPFQLTDARWYPSMAPLPEGGYLVAGGGGLDNPRRVRTSEVFDPDTLQWRRVGDLALGTEVSPVVLLFTGEVLMTHRPPQLYDPAIEQWRLAGDFVQANRMANGDHADHEMVMLPDGRVVAAGFKSFEAGRPGRMIEIYDPARNEWTLGADVRPVRSRASILLLPDTRVLILGGEKQEPDDPTPTNQWNQVALTDLYDPATDTARRLANLNIAREYHAMPVLLPDGRVAVVGGEERPGVAPSRSVVEMYSPPYLFRGPRPRIADLDADVARPGDTLRFRVERTRSPTRVVLVGAIATTHFMDSGPGRHVDLPFDQAGDEITATIPAEPARAVPGVYLLFVMVDDIPSFGRLIRIERQGP